MENKKAKFNGMDLFIILVVIAVIAAGAYLLCGRGGGGSVLSSQNVLVRTVIELDVEDKEFADLVKVGDTVAIGEKEKMMTTVEKVEAISAAATGYDIIEGRVIRAKIPEKYDVQITLVGDGVETDKDVEISGNAIKVGQKAVVSSKNFAGEGYVVGLETEAKN